MSRPTTRSCGVLTVVVAVALVATATTGTSRAGANPAGSCGQFVDYCPEDQVTDPPAEGSATPADTGGGGGSACTWQQKGLVDKSGDISNDAP